MAGTRARHGRGEDGGPLPLREDRLRPEPKATTPLGRPDQAGFRGMRSVTGQPPTPSGARDREEDEAEVVRAEKLATRLSIARSRDRLAAALAVPCVEHAADAGAYCYGTADSLVKGVCPARYERGVQQVAAGRPATSNSAPAPFVDALAERAAATRNAALHERQREHQQRQQARFQQNRDRR